MSDHEPANSHGLRKELGFRDLVPMQVLMVVGLTWAGNISYAIYYILMFAVPLVAGGRLGPKPGLFLSLGCVSGIMMSAIAIAFSFLPVVDVKDPVLFAIKIGVSTLIVNSLGVLLYWRGARRLSAQAARQAA